MTDLVLLTGATGFVGRQILRALAELGRRVRVVVRAGEEALLPAAGNIEQVEITPDLFAEDVSWHGRVCQDVDILIHSAWYVEPGKYLQSPLNLDCLAGTLRLAQGAAHARVRRLVGVGTCFEYDLSGGVLAVTTPLRPTTPYAGAKAAAYLALAPWCQFLGIEFVWCRLFYLYGEKEAPGRLVPYLRAQLAAGAPALLTAGRQIRDYLDVQEAGRRIARCALGTGQGPVNICSGEPRTVRQLAEQIADEYGRRDLLKFGARSDNITDPPCVVGRPNDLEPGGMPSNHEVQT